MSKILLIDDDVDVLKINKKYLENVGFKVYATNVAEKGIEFACKNLPDCILLDVMMPEINGYAVCKRIHDVANIPIIFLSGRGSEDDKIKGLSLGAEDYIVKPYSLRELKARIDVLLRRATPVQTIETSSKLVFSDLTIDKMAHKVFYQTEDLQLTNREYEVLLYMAEHPNREISFEELGNMIFGGFQASDRSSIMVIVSRIRKKFGEFPGLSNMLKTIWSVGYSFDTK